MDTRTGEIIELTDELFKKEIKDFFKDSKFIKDPSPNNVRDFIKITEGQMTEKQKEEMQVSKFDNRSILGKIFAKFRKIRRMREK